jgi:hypothetical protein
MDVGSLRAERAVAFGPHSGLALSCDDAPTLAWALEFFGPTLQPAAGVEGDRVVVETAVELYSELAARRPADAVERPCFAFDQSMQLLPVVESKPGLLAFDPRRSCVLALRPSEARLVGHPDSSRWRFDLVLVMHELIATRLRPTQLEIHAAGVEAGGMAVLLVGPKGAGKTTVSFHLLRSGLVGWLANDRVFAGREAGSIAIRGVPTVLRVRAATAGEFPELRSGLSAIERPYLHASGQRMPRPEEEPRRSNELMLSPPQVAARLGAEQHGAAPLGALVFPRVDPSRDGWDLEPLARAELVEGLWANLFGDAARSRPPTVFEELAGGRAEPDRELAEEMAAAPGFRLVLGRGAYEDPDFAQRFLAALGSLG